MFPLPLHTATRPLANALRLPVANSRRSAATLFTLARHSASPTRADPTKTAPADINKIRSRTALVARHLSASTTTHSSTNITMASLPVSEKGYHSKAPSAYSVRKVGAPHTLEHRIYIEKDGVPVSPFHDIPLYANEQQTILNMVVEIPRWTNAKQEVRFLPFAPPC